MGLSEASDRRCERLERLVIFVFIIDVRLTHRCGARKAWNKHCPIDLIFSLRRATLRARVICAKIRDAFICLDNGCIVTTVKKVSPRVSFLGYLKFFT